MTPSGAITLQSLSGLKLKLHPIGARITSFLVPLGLGDKEIVQTFPNINGFIEKSKYSGATIGPFANRIEGGQFALNGQSYQLEKNEGNNCLHSGLSGLHLSEWKVISQTDNEVIFEITRAHLEDGFPGNRIFRCSYSLNEDDLNIHFYGASDRDTVMNMTNHSYFNLDHEAHLDNHFFMIDSKGALELNKEGIPTGTVIPAIGDFNLSVFQRLNNRVFDHNFILSDPDMMELAAAAYCPSTDITMEVFTDQPGMQFFTGKKSFFAFETQHFPDSPNHPTFPSTLVTKDQPYDHHCIYRLNY